MALRYAIAICMFMLMLMLMLIIYVNAQPPSGTGCPEAFKGKCHCGKVPYINTGKLTYVTNCTNSNFNETSMLTQLPIDTEVLIFIGNNVSTLPANLFGKDAEYDNLHTIDMSQNHIEYIKGKTFHKVNNVRVLNLSHNEINIDKNLHPRIFSNFINLEELSLKNAFGNTKQSKHDVEFINDLMITFVESGFEKLKVLNLEYNYIFQFPNDSMFCLLPKLQKLYLGNNWLIDFNLNLTCLEDLYLLDISDNFITALHNKSMEYLETGRKLYHVNISRNPFRCDCNIKEFIKWLRIKHNRTIFFENIRLYQCSTGFPMDIGGRFLDEIDETHLTCSRFFNDDFGSNYFINFSYAILTSLLVTLFLLLVALMYTNRAHIVAAWRYVATGIATKREYTSLEKENKRHQQQVNHEVAEVEV